MPEGTSRISIWLDAGSVSVVELSLVRLAVGMDVPDAARIPRPTTGKRGLPMRLRIHCARVASFSYGLESSALRRSRRIRMWRSRRTMRFVITGTVGGGLAEEAAARSLAVGTRALQTGQRAELESRKGSMQVGW